MAAIPALLRRIFDLGCAYSGQILSYQKMLGQLHDAGNTTTLALKVKSGAKKTVLPGMEEFAKSYPKCRKLLVGAQGIPIEKFLSQTTAIVNS